MATQTPLALVKDKFGDKAKLVAAVETLTGQDLWVSRTNKNKGLAHVSNAKLLRLHATFTAVKEKFGTREKLIDAILELEGRAKDAGLRDKLVSWPVPRLFDTYKAAAKRKASDKRVADGIKAPKKVLKAPAAPKVKASKTGASKKSKNAGRKRK